MAGIRLEVEGNERESITSRLLSRYQTPVPYRLFKENGEGVDSEHMKER